MLGVVAVDPGGTTGVAWGWFDLELDSVGEMLKFGEGVGWGELTGSEPYQAAKIVEVVDRMKASGIGERVDLVIEDFILRPGRATAGREMLSPVRITSLVEGIMLEREVGVSSPLGSESWEFIRGERPFCVQMPSAAKSFATKERLVRWGVWHKGMRHARDAWRHIALRLATVEGL